MHEDRELGREEIQVENKKFVFRLMVNKRGKFLRVTESRDNQTNTICIPLSGVRDVGGLITKFQGG